MDDKALVRSKIIDKINIYEKTGEVQATSFLDPLDIIENASIYNKYLHFLCGGSDEAERCRLVIGIDNEEAAKEYVAIIKIESIKKLSHRNVLGSVLGLGLVRDVIGDIIVDETNAYVFVNSEIKDYIINNLKMVGREKVKLSNCSFDEIDNAKEEFEMQNFTLASLRIDSAISECYGLSRTISSKLIESEKVKLNYRMISNPSKAIKQGDLISVRGYGRFVINEVIGETRKGRIRVSIKKYGNN